MAPASHISSEKERAIVKEGRPARGKERIDYRELGKKGTSKPLASPPIDTKCSLSHTLTHKTRACIRTLSSHFVYFRLIWRLRIYYSLKGHTCTKGKQTQSETQSSSTVGSLSLSLSCFHISSSNPAFLFLTFVFKCDGSYCRSDRGPATLLAML
jgi:hypothetical protein